MGERFRSLRTWIPAVLCVGLTAAPAAAQGFVERSREIGLVHPIASGFDRVGDATWSFDWAQSGIALGDIDGDGDIDLVASGGLFPDRAWVNRDGVFEDATVVAGIASPELHRVPALGDFDADGDLDLWLGALAGGVEPLDGRGRLFRNDGTGRFEEVSVLAGTLGGGRSIDAKWADLDLDGLLDLYVSEFHATGNRYYRNNGDGTFTEGAAELGIDSHGSTHVSAIFDSDMDGYYELFVGNDYLITEAVGLPDPLGDRMFSCRDDFLFEDVSPGSGQEHDRAVMGMAVADVNYDGRFDLYKADGGANHLMINRGWPGTGIAWSEEQAGYGIVADEVVDPNDPTVTAPAVSWGAAFFDADLDGWLDLFVANGFILGLDPDQNFHLRDQQNFFYKGRGPEEGFVFEDATATSGLLDHHDDRGIALGDVDRDGDLDLFVVPTEGTLRYYENRAERAEGHWLIVEPVCRTSAPGCQGVQIGRWDERGHVHLRVLGADAPTASQHDDTKAYFGLGDETRTDLLIQFPSGIEYTYGDAPADTVLRPEEPEMIRLPSRTVPPSDGVTPSTYTVTVFAHSSFAVPLDGDAEVSIEIDGWVPSGPVEHLEGNRFERTFEIPIEPGSHRVDVRFDTFDLRVEPWVHVLGPFDVAASTLHLRPEAVRAGTDDAYRILFAPKDASGLSLGPGQDISVSLAGPSEALAATDHGDGRYSATLPAPPAPGRYDVEVYFQGDRIAASDGLTIAAAGPASHRATEVYLEMPTELHSASPHLARVMVTPRDEAGRPLGPQAEVELVVYTDPDSPTVTVRHGLRGPRPDGSFPFLLEKETTVEPNLARGRFVVEVAGQPVASSPFEF